MAIPKDAEHPAETLVSVEVEFASQVEPDPKRLQIYLQVARRGRPGAVSRGVPLAKPEDTPQCFGDSAAGKTPACD